MRRTRTAIAKPNITKAIQWYNGVYKDKVKGFVDLDNLRSYLEDYYIDEYDQTIHEPGKLLPEHPVAINDVLTDQQLQEVATNILGNYEENLRYLTPTLEVLAHDFLYNLQEDLQDMGLSAEEVSSIVDEAAQDPVLILQSTIPRSVFQALKIDPNDFPFFPNNNVRWDDLVNEEKLEDNYEELQYFLEGAMESVVPYYLEKVLFSRGQRSRVMARRKTRVASAADLSAELEEIAAEIKDLIYNARGILRQVSSLPGGELIRSRAEGYWVPHILMAIDEESEWRGGSSYTMMDTVGELNELGGPGGREREEEYEDEDEDYED